MQYFPHNQVSEPTYLPVDDASVPPPDIWEDPKFENLGQIAYYGVFIVAGLGAIAGAVASSFYNEGAVGVDFKAAATPEEAVSKAIKASIEAQGGASAPAL